MKSRRYRILVHCCVAFREDSMTREKLSHFDHHNSSRNA